MPASKMFFKPVIHQLPIERKKRVNVYKSRSQLLQDFLKNYNGPLTLKNSKFLDVQEKLHKTRKELENKRRKAILINKPICTVFKAKSPPKTKKANGAGPSKLKKSNGSGPSKPKNNVRRCPALKLDLKMCNAKLKGNNKHCGRHTKK